MAESIYGISDPTAALRSMSLQHKERISLSASQPAASRSPEFMVETKYVVLNFMNLLPREMYCGHISASPDSIPEFPEHDRFANRSSLRKSQSFDTADYKGHFHGKANKHLKKLQSLSEMNSPASEDNLNYRYRKNVANFESLERHQSDIESPVSDRDFEKSHGTGIFHGSRPSSSLSQSPQKSQRSPQRIPSDVSSSGDYSYESDADDELEDNSNASSIFSSHSLSYRDGFLDLRRSIPKLQTLVSQSDLDEVDAAIHSVKEVIEEGKEVTFSHEAKALDTEPNNSNSNESLKSRRGAADRSKLRLNIPCEPLVMDDTLISLQSELNSEFSEVELEMEEMWRSSHDNIGELPSSPPLTPQTEAARTLARIGDELNQQYGSEISSAVSELLCRHMHGTFTYENIKEIALAVIDENLRGWRKVALLLVFSQKMMWGILQQGQKNLSDLIDMCTILIADLAAEFIIMEGGWAAVMNCDHSQSSDTQSSSELDYSHGIQDFTNSHDVTQVERGAANDENLQQVVETNEGALDTGGVNGLHNTKGKAAERQHLAPSDTHIHGNRYLPSLGFDVSEQSGSYEAGDCDVNTDQELDSAFIRSAFGEQNFDRPNNSDTKQESVGMDSFQPGTEHSAAIVKSAVFTFNDTDLSERNNNKTIKTGDTAATLITGTTAVNDIKSKGSDYSKDCVYVKQDTPTLGPDELDPAQDTRVDVKVEQDKSEGSQLNSQTGDSPKDENKEHVRQEACDEKELESHSEVESSSWIDDMKKKWSRVVALGLAVLTLGVAVRLATLNR